MPVSVTSARRTTQHGDHGAAALLTRAGYRTKPPRRGLEAAVGHEDHLVPGSHLAPSASISASTVATAATAPVQARAITLAASQANSGRCRNTTRIGIGQRGRQRLGVCTLAHRVGARLQRHQNPRRCPRWHADRPAWWRSPWDGGQSRRRRARRRPRRPLPCRRFTLRNVANAGSKARRISARGSGRGQRRQGIHHVVLAQQRPTHLTHRLAGMSHD